MAAAKGENDYGSRKGDKAPECASSSRRNLKFKLAEHTEGTSKKQTRAQTRTAVSDDTGISQNTLNKAREKGRLAGDRIKDDGITVSKKDLENSEAPKKEMDPVGLLKRDIPGTAFPKRDTVTGKKEPGLVLPKKDETLALPRKEIIPVSILKKPGVMHTKTRGMIAKLTSRLSGEKKRDDRLNPAKSNESKSEVTTSDKIKSKEEKIKADRKENGTSIKVDGEKNIEIMNSDVTSSVDVASKAVRNHSSGLMLNTKETGWNLGDLAWGRVGQYPFWPCMIAVDPQTGSFSKTKRIGRGLNSFQQSLHVQFFGDKGRHSWIPNTCVIKYEGKDQFQKFADKVLLEMKRKDKRYSSAFIVKPASKPKWEIAVREAEESVPKAREDRIIFFQELLPKRKTSEKAEHYQKTGPNGKTTQSMKKKKRPSSNRDVKPSKLMKMEKGRVALKVESEDEKKSENNMASMKKKRTGNKNQIGECELSDSSPLPNVPRLALFLRRNIRKTLRQ